MTYTHVRFAYYDTRTAEQYQPAILTAKQIVLDTLSEIRVRAQYFVEVARYVAREIAKNPGSVSGRVLTIFAAPEFYFRSSNGQEGGPGHYHGREVDEARALIMDSLAHDSRFDDWLLVPGTAVYSNFSSFWLIWNDAYCIAPGGGPRGAFQEWHVVKQNFHSYDKLDTSLNAFTFGKTQGLIYQQIMTLNGVDIGFEICRDHVVRVLKNTVLSHNPPSNVDVQLVLSCGAGVESQSVATRSHGLALGCNGDDNFPAGMANKVGIWPNGRPALGDMPPLSRVTATILDLPKGLQIRPDKNKTDKVGYYPPLELIPPP